MKRFAAGLVIGVCVGIMGCGDNDKSDSDKDSSARDKSPPPSGGSLTKRGAIERMNNLKLIGLGLITYLDVHRRFPAQANYSADGKPLLSWRVHILPTLGYDDLYKQFHLDEPWDSEHNQRLLLQMPDEFKSTTDNKTTTFLGFAGPGAMFDGQQGPGMGQILDGSSNTVLVVDAGKSVPWTKPEDLTFDPADPIGSLGPIGDSKFPALFADGAVIWLSSKAGPETIKALITIDGGEVINLENATR